VPIYDYVCESCGNVVEVVHPISAPGPATCAVCGGRMKRALSTPAIVFKGSGWAKKDARDASRSKARTGTAGADTTAGGTEGGPTATEGPATTPDAGSGTTTPAAAKAAGSSGGSSTATS
jgi:putative FmdB family regulatory protein